MVFIFPILLLLLINIWIFMPFFSLGLFGDDWLAIFRYSYYLDEPKHLGPYSTEYFNHFKYLLNAYGSQEMIMAFLYKTFGEGSNIYFILSYILRVGAGGAIYFPAFYITKNKLAAYFAVFFFLFSSTGLEASSWVFNMPSYLAVIFFNSLLYFYLRFHKEKKLEFLLLSFIFFTFTFVSTPIRAHGLIPFIIFMEMVWVISTGSLRVVKLSLIRIGGFLLIFLIIYFLGLRETISGNFFNAVIYGLNNTLLLLSQNHFDFLFYPIATLGSMLIPDSFAPNFGAITSFHHYIFKILLPIFLIYIILTTILKHTIDNLNPKFFKLTALLGVFWAIAVLIIYRFNVATFSNSNHISLLLIGGYLLITASAMVVYLQSNTFKKVGLLIALGWILISYLYPWWTTPQSLSLTTHRYLIVSSAGMSLLFAMIISLGKNTKSIITLFTISSIFLIFHSFYLRNFLNMQYQTHNRALVKKIWSQIPYIPNIGKTDKPIVFYFEGDQTNGNILHDAITFGFPFHIGLIYNVIDHDKIPPTMDSWEEVVSAVKDGKSFIKHYSKAIDPIPIDNVYVFKLEGKDNLINLTETARAKLKQIK